MQERGADNDRIASRGQAMGKAQRGGTIAMRIDRRESGAVEGPEGEEWALLGQGRRARGRRNGEQGKNQK